MKVLVACCVFVGMVILPSWGDTGQGAVPPENLIEEPVLTSLFDETVEPWAPLSSCEGTSVVDNGDLLLDGCVHAPAIRLSKTHFLTQLRMETASAVVIILRSEVSTRSGYALTLSSEGQVTLNRLESENTVELLEGGGSAELGTDPKACDLSLLVEIDTAGSVHELQAWVWDAADPQPTNPLLKGSDVSLFIEGPPIVFAAAGAARFRYILVGGEAQETKITNIAKRDETGAIEATFPPGLTGLQQVLVRPSFFLPTIEETPYWFEGAGDEPSRVVLPRIYKEGSFRARSLASGESVDALVPNFIAGTVQATLTWESLPNERYAIERSFDLRTWTPLDFFVAGTLDGTSTTVEVPVISNTNDDRSDVAAYLRVIDLD